MTGSRLTLATLEERLAAQLAKDRAKPSRCRRDGDQIIVTPSGRAVGLAIAIENITGEDTDAILNRVGAAEGERIGQRNTHRLPTSAEAVSENLALLCEPRGADWHMELVTGHLSAWSAEIRVTLQPGNPDGPDRSLVTFAAGGPTADDAAVDAYLEMRAWLASGEGGTNG